MGMNKIVIVIVLWQIICIVNADKSRNVAKDKGFTYIGSFKSSENSTQLGQRFDEKRYYVSPNAAPWSRAVEGCSIILGPPYSGLVAIETVEEWEFLKDLLENYGFGNSYWTSGQFDLLRSEWVWSTNNQPIFESPPWSPGFPSTPTSGLRIQINYTNRFDNGWRTAPGTQLHRFICEVRKIDWNQMNY